MDKFRDPVIPRFAPSLRWMLSLGFAAAALLGVLAVMGTWFYYGRPILVSVVSGQLQQSANDAAQSLKRSLIERRREMELAATRMPLVASDADGMRLFLKRLQEATPFYALTGLIGPDGRFVATSNGIAEGEDVANRDYFRIGRRHTFVSDAHEAILLAKSLGAGDAGPRLIDIATPVFDGDKFIGVLAAHLSAEWAHEAGAAVTHSLFARFPHSRVELRDGSGALLFESGDTISGGRDLGPDPLSAEALVDGIGETGAIRWQLRVIAPRAYVGALISPVRWAAGVGGAIAVMLAALVGAMLAGALVRPLEGYTSDAMSLGTRPRPRFRHSPAREINDLGAALRVASDELSNRADSNPAA